MELGQFANMEAEDAVLGSILLEGELSDEVFAILGEDDFYSLQHRLIFHTIKDLKSRGKPIDALIVCDELTKNNQMESAGGNAKIVDLMNKVISSVRIGEYCQIVKERSRLRSLLKSLGDVQTKAKNGEFRSTKELLDFTESVVMKLSLERTAGIFQMPELVKAAIITLEERYKRGDQIIGVPTGFPSIDKMTSGLQPGEVVIIGARPSMGKTTLSLNIATHMAVTSRKAIAYFSLEMPKETILLKLISMYSGVSFDNLKTGRVRDQDWSPIINASGSLADARFYIDDSPGLSPYEIRSKCRKLKREGNLDCIIIDYLGLMKLRHERYESREREISEISASLKEIAKELKIPVVALAQLNREVEKRAGDQKPKIADLRDSGSIEQDADVIMLLYRPGYYDKTDEDKKDEAELIVDKNRNGPTGHIKMKFKPDVGRFVEI